MPVGKKNWNVGDRVLPANMVFEKGIFYKAYVRTKIALPKGFLRFPDEMKEVTTNARTEAEKKWAKDHVRKHRVNCIYYVSGRFGYLHQYDGLYFPFQLMTWEEGLEWNIRLLTQKREGLIERMEKEAQLWSLDSQIEQFQKYLDQLKRSGEVAL